MYMPVTCMTVNAIFNHLLSYNAVRCLLLPKKGSLSCHYNSVLDFAQGVSHGSHVSKVFTFEAVFLIRGLDEMYSVPKEGETEGVKFFRGQKQV